MIFNHLAWIPNVAVLLLPIVHCNQLYIIIIYDVFLPPPIGGVVISNQITHTQSSNKHHLARILDTCALIFSCLCPFYRLSQPHHVTASHSSPGHNHQSTRGRSEKTQEEAKMAAWNSFSYICTRALHSFRFFAASTAIPLLPTATFTPSIQPDLDLPSTRHPLTSSINTHLAIRYSTSLSTCLNHLNTLWSALLANSLSILALLPTSSFLTLSIRDSPT